MLYEKSKAKDIIADKTKLNDIVSETLDKMARTVGATLGPGGRPVLIERDGKPPLATKDGVTVAKSLGLDRAEDNIIVEAAKEICINTAKDAGDGTTTAIVLANAITKYGHEFIANNAKYNPQRIVNELEDLYEDIIVPHIKSQSQDVSAEEKLVNVATISANGDKRIAKVVVDAVMAAGDDGHVLIEEAQGDEMRVETIDGYIITAGLKEIGQLGPMFMNDKANQQCNMDDGHVFLYNGTINDSKVLGFLEQALQEDEFGNLTYDGSPVIIIAHEFSDTALDQLAKNAKKGISLCPIKTPRSGLPNSKTVFLEDIAAYTNAKVFDPSNIGEIEQEDLGSFVSAKSNLYETFIVSDVDHERIDARVKELKAIESSCFSDMDRMHVRANIAKLTGGISTIHVGGVSDLKVRERKGRVEDAVEAVSGILLAAMPDGVGGVTEENIQSRLRGVLLMALSNKTGDMLVTTGNKSEVSVGYATLYGDMNGGFNPIKDLYKTKVYALSRLRNEVLPEGCLGPSGVVIPENIITKAPTAELRENQTDQDSLPPYDRLDDILACLIEKVLPVAEIVKTRGIDLEEVKRIEHLLYLAEYKRRQAAPGVKISSKNFGRGRRYPITNKYRD